MRMLIYIHSLDNGGAERVVANLANYWVSKGWEITVVTVASAASDFYVLDPAVRRIALNLTGSSGNVFAGFLRTVKRAIALRRALKLVRPDIALSAMHTANVILAIAARGLPDVRAFGSEHNFPPKAPMGIIWETMRRHAYGQLTAVVALTQECGNWLTLHSHARHIRVIPNAVCWPLPNHEPNILPSTFCLPGRKILLGVGRLSVEKNFSTLIGIFSHLALKHPTWDLVVLGEGPLRNALYSQVQAAGLEQRVFLPGSVGNLGDWYERASMYALSSHFEGFPNTLVEAMAHGLPAVSFDCDTGPRDIIRHNIDGVLVRPDDVVDMEVALDKLMGDAALMENLGSRASEVRERFSMKKISSMWEDLFMAPTALAARAKTEQPRVDQVKNGDDHKINV